MNNDDLELILSDIVTALGKIIFDYKELESDKKIDFMRGILKNKENFLLTELKEILKKHDIESLEEFFDLYDNNQIHFAKTDFQKTHEFICNCGVKLILKDSDENVKNLIACQLLTTYANA